ncbi:hypothetical protein FACS1894122_07420 [Alphaproteobacteria bacterium]|nr:hypothetical protein FACS1894122_07420 [Alphaproteobacteria bacterium]
MTYTTLRYLIVLGLLLNILPDVNGSEEVDATSQLDEDRSQSVSPPAWNDPRSRVYNQINLAPLFISDSARKQNDDSRKALKKHGLEWNGGPDRSPSPAFSTSDGPYVEPEWKSSEHMHEIRNIEGRILSDLDDNEMDIGSKIDMESSVPLMSCIHDVFWNTYVQSISNGKSRNEAIAGFIEHYPESEQYSAKNNHNVAVAITEDSKFLDEVDKQIAKRKAIPSS